MAYDSTTWADDSLTAATALTTTNEAVSVGGTLTVSGASTLSNTLTVGEDDTGYDVKLFGDTSGKYMLWDTSANALKVVGDFQVTGEISVGTSAGLHQLHISDGSTSGLSTGNEAEIVITDDGIARIYFEDTGEGSGDRVMAIGYYNENLVIQSLSDDGTSYDVESILSANRDGAVTLGGSSLVATSCIAQFAAVVAGSLTSSSTFLLDVADDVTIDAGGGNIYLKDDGVTYMDIQVDGSNDKIAVTGDLTLDVSGDIVLDAAGKDISLTDGSGTAEFIINLEDAPEIDVDGDFTLDVNGGITLDANNGIFTFSDGGTVRAKFDTGTRLFQGNSEGSQNTIFGYNAGLEIASGSDKNTFFGHQVSQAAMDGNCDQNTGIGYHALYAMTTGDYNTIVGSQAGDAITEGSTNTAVGRGSLSAITTADANVAIGASAMNSSTVGYDNVAIGHLAISSMTGNDVYRNVAIGKNAMTGSSGGGAINCIAIGYQAGYTSSDGGQNNINIGTNSGVYGSGSGDSNTFVGMSSGYGVDGTPITGANNVGIGKDAAYLLQGAAHSNTFIGTSAGNTTTTGVENTILGYNCEAQDATATNQVVIGNNLNGTKDNAVFIGNDSSHIENDFNTDATWNHSSDRRQKKNIKDDTLGLNFIKNLRTVTYKHKSPSEFPQEWDAYDVNDTKPMGIKDKVIHGFIAQEVKEALDKENVSTFGGWSEGPDGRQRVSFEAFVMPLIKAVQELSAQVEELKSKVGE